MNGKSQDDSGEKGRLEPQSMHPLSVEEALRGFMEVDPEKVKGRLESEKDDADEDE